MSNARSLEPTRPAETLSDAEVESRDRGIEIIDRNLSDVEADRVPDERLGKFLGW